MSQDLRTCQREAKAAIEANNVGIIRMACGSGKTTVEIITLANNKGISVWIAPRNALIDQLKQNFEDYTNKHKTKTTSIVVINCKNDYDLTKCKKKNVCYLINNSSLKKTVPKITGISLLVVDEAHTHKKEVKENFKDCPRRYFFTATPQDMKDPFYGKTIYDYSYKQALQDGIVCDFKLVPVKGLEDLYNKMKKYKSNNTIHFYENVKSSKRNEYLEGDYKILTQGTRLMEDRCILKISSGTKDKNEVLEQFRKKEGVNLLSCQTISYGIDIVECDSVYLSYVSNSIPDNIQKIMRGIRKNEHSPDKVCHIYILIDDFTNEEENRDITEEMKTKEQSTLFHICTFLKQGLDIDILAEYISYRNLTKFKEYIEKMTNTEEQSSSSVVSNNTTHIGVDLNPEVSDKVKQIINNDGQIFTENGQAEALQQISSIIRENYTECEDIENETELKHAHINQASNNIRNKYKQWEPLYEDMDISYQLNNGLISVNSNVDTLDEWDIKYNQHKAFTDTNGRLVTQTDNPEIYEWLIKQAKIICQKTSMLKEHKEKLDLLPGWKDFEKTYKKQKKRIDTWLTRREPKDLDILFRSMIENHGKLENSKIKAILQNKNPTYYYNLTSHNHSSNLSIYFEKDNEYHYIKPEILKYYIK